MIPNLALIVFTLGRDREKQHAKQYLRSGAESWRIDAVIDAVHDLLEGVKAPQETASVFAEAFVHGGSGEWEQTGSWLRKLFKPGLCPPGLWQQFCAHKSAKIRFRAASFLDDMPDDAFKACFPALLTDKSANVRAKAASETRAAKEPRFKELLRDRLLVETSETVRASIEYGLMQG